MCVCVFFVCVCVLWTLAIVFRRFLRIDWSHFHVMCWLELYSKDAAKEDHEALRRKGLGG